MLTLFCQICRSYILQDKSFDAENDTALLSVPALKSINFYFKKGCGTFIFQILRLWRNMFFDQRIQLKK